MSGIILFICLELLKAALTASRSVTCHTRHRGQSGYELGCHHRTFDGRRKDAVSSCRSFCFSSYYWWVNCVIPLRVLAYHSGEKTIEIFLSVTDSSPIDCKSFPHCMFSRLEEPPHDDACKRKKLLPPLPALAHYQRNNSRSQNSIINPFQ
jgi:hypothetical protein